MNKSPSALPAALLRRRNTILASGSASLLFIVAGVLINGQYADIAGDDVLSLLSMVALSLAPFVGLPAVFLGNRDLEGIQRRIIPSSLYAPVKWGRLSGLTGTTTNAVLLLVFLLQALAAAELNQVKDDMMADMQTIIQAASEYRSHPDTTSQSIASYEGFAIPPALVLNDRGYYTMRVLHPDTIQLLGQWMEDSASAIRVAVGPEGTPGKWEFYGSFREN